MTVEPCSECGTIPEADARFCGGCGRRLGAPPTHSREPFPRPTEPVPVIPVQDQRSAPRIATPPARASTPPPRVNALAVGRSPSPSRLPTPSPMPMPATLAVPVARPVRPAPQGSPPELLQTIVEDASAIAARMEPAPRAEPHPPAQPMALDDLVGRTLNGRYEVGPKIGEGGFGAVFEGRQVATGREVALKVLHPHNVADRTVVARFRREAEASSRLRSAHTVTIYDFDQTSDGTLYLAMELVRGRSLQDLQRQEGPLPPARTLRLLHQIAEALAEAHDQGLVHRDMKPENVMIETREGEDFVKVLDFGITKIISGDPARKGPALTVFGQTVGTLEFMSPEQLRGATLDGRSDLYGVGMMAYEMLTGDLPFVGAKGSTEIINFHMQVVPPPPSRMRPDLHIPSVVDDLVEKLVAKRPEDRHASAHELRRQAEQALAVIAGSTSRKKMVRVLVVVAALAALATGAVAALRPLLVH
jgi:tRNA A-37 threonylcarbamoyl transferase component Bud32